jgi:hypothetical protein
MKNTDQLANVVRTFLAQRRTLEVGRLAKESGLPRRDVGIQLSRWYSARDLAFSDADGKIENAHTHVTFLGETFSR